MTLLSPTSRYETHKIKYYLLHCEIITSLPNIKKPIPSHHIASIMLSRSSSSVLFVIAALLMASSSVHAFTTTSSTTTTPGRFIQGARYQPKSSSKGISSSNLVLASILRKMSASDDDEAAKSKISADGTFYDDEVNTEPIKDGLSDSMKARLMAEASTGLDSDKKQNNTILYIGVVVAILVALAGSGILY